MKELGVTIRKCLKLSIVSRCSALIGWKLSSDVNNVVASSSHQEKNMKVCSTGKKNVGETRVLFTEF